MSFLWRNVDSLIGMQDYIEQQINWEHPSYADIANNKADQKFRKLFSNPEELIKKMKDMRKKKTAILTIGLWPLKFESYNNWWITSYGPKIFPKYIKMAQIEIYIIGEYRKLMFEKCLSAVHICTGPTSLEVSLKKGGKMQKKPV